ncbi:nitrilotriacetate monooxygenase component A [Candidatus Burkholderia verschuerenii]|uniref:Nitrilotriacetate monooxygenase component A n=1 Tax=Candidatus Burkholderia verschuerenii TaxID=242163 RepID=A0A0L0M674_9BURK|nr:nitrilotriacetate monooxygenase component A [Candidatus Burkholderia verschuerenii]
MTAKSPKQMTLIGFLQAQNCSTYPGSWRHSAAMQDFTTPEYYQRIARTLEEGKFHLAFFDDRLAMPDIYGNDHAQTTEHGVCAVKMDLISILTAMGMATSKLGLGATYSTTYYEPFHIARTFGTLDLMTKGCAAWNVVTSLNDSEAANFGQSEHLEHDLRYDRADEFVETVMGHWDTWEEGALILDKESGRFADPSKVHRLDHEGRFFKSRGPFTVPRSQQGHPVLIQAWQSGRGRQFASRWADLIFVVYPKFEVAKKQYAEMKQALSDAGRNPDDVKISTACYTIVAESDEIAQKEREYLDALAKPIDSLALLCEVLNTDFSKRGYDDPFSDAEMAAISGWTGFRDRVVTLSGKKNPSVCDFVDFSKRAHRRVPGVLRHREDRRRSDGAMVRRRRGGWLRDRADARAGRIRRLRAQRRAGTAATRPVPQGLHRRHAARKSRPADSEVRRLAQDGVPEGVEYQGRVTMA